MKQNRHQDYSENNPGMDTNDLRGNHSHNALTEQGVIVKVEDAFVYVKAESSAGCGGCKSQSGCGTSSLAKLFSNRRDEPIKVLKTQACSEGDRVELLLDESRLLKHSFMAYGLPLIGMFIFAITVFELALNGLALAESLAELLSVTAGFLGLLVGWKVTQAYYQPILPTIGKVYPSE